MSHENIHRSWLEKEWIVLGDFPRWISGLPEGITINSTGLSGTMETFLGKKNTFRPYCRLALLMVQCEAPQ